jgi:stage V sporulation protein R
MTKKQKPMFSGTEWTFPLLDRVYKECEEIALDELKLNVYPNSIEIIGSDQMLELYSSVGLPVNYSHWSFGKHFLRDEFSYRKGQSGLAYEIVINSQPVISYLMEENNMLMQTLVIAHAAFGHNAVFANNYLFKQWTNAEGILDYMLYARDFIEKCEMKYGTQAVEELLDSCHALMTHGVDKYKRPPAPSKEEQQQKQKEIELANERSKNDLWRTVPESENKEEKEEDIYLREPQENILYFLEKNSPILESWQREIVRIIRKIAQYFYPQRMTQTVNEGFATFTHYYIMTRLMEKGLLTDGQYLEFLHNHTNVVTQREFDNKYYSGFNPYWLGFNMFMDIKRMCQNPTKEDEQWFPDLVGTDWVSSVKDAMMNYRDESFIRQFLSPKMIRENRLFVIDDNETDKNFNIINIHNESGYRDIRRFLADSKNTVNGVPDIAVIDANMKGDRSLTLAHMSYDGMKLNEANAKEVLKHVNTLWGYPVEMISVDGYDHKKVIGTFKVGV